jgi:hypothetical protein
MSKNLTIDLKPRLDKNKQTFYVGKLECPALIDCSEGVVFLVYISEEGCEQLQIANIDDKKDKDDGNL